MAVEVRGPGDGRRARRTGRTGGRRGAAGAWSRTPGWRRSPARAQRPSTASDGGACCCATSSASGQPRCTPLVSRERRFRQSWSLDRGTGVLWSVFVRVVRQLVEPLERRPPGVDRLVVLV